MVDIVDWNAARMENNLIQTQNLVGIHFFNEALHAGCLQLRPVDPKQML